MRSLKIPEIVFGVCMMLTVIALMATVVALMALSPMAALYGLGSAWLAFMAGVLALIVLFVFY